MLYLDGSRQQQSAQRWRDREQSFSIHKGSDLGLLGYEGFLGFFTSRCEYSVLGYYTASMII